MNDIESLLTSYQIAVTEIKNALRQAGLSEREINEQTRVYPEFGTMLPEDAENLYKEIKLRFILYLNDILRLSNREIARRLGGTSYVTVNEILKAYKVTGEIKKASINEVSLNV